ncbi:MAG: response regulator transcription factor [Trebonia sp.]|jgi:DNA-binding NarL/FixJ family response regulator
MAEMVLSSNTRVLIVGGLQIVNEALQRALRTVAGIRVIGVGRDLVEARLFLADLPDVILVWDKVDGGTAAQLVEQIISDSPQARVVVLSTEADDESLHSLVTAGASGLVNLQQDGFDTLVSALHRAAAGEFLLSADTLRRIIKHQRTETLQQRKRADVVRRLTERELEILALVGIGLDNRMIAEKLTVSVTTVRSHVQHMLAKLGLHSRLEAAVFAARHELVADGFQASTTVSRGRRAEARSVSSVGAAQGASPTDSMRLCKACSDASGTPSSR